MGRSTNASVNCKLALASFSPSFSLFVRPQVPAGKHARIAVVLTLASTGSAEELQRERTVERHIQASFKSFVFCVREVEARPAHVFFCLSRARSLQLLLCGTARGSLALLPCALAREGFEDGGPARAYAPRRWRRAWS